MPRVHGDHYAEELDDHETDGQTDGQVAELPNHIDHYQPARLSIVDLRWLAIETCSAVDELDGIGNVLSVVPGAHAARRWNDI